LYLLLTSQNEKKHHPKIDSDKKTKYLQTCKSNVSFFVFILLFSPFRQTAELGPFGSTTTFPSPALGFPGRTVHRDGAVAHSQSARLVAHFPVNRGEGTVAAFQT